MKEKGKKSYGRVPSIQVIASQDKTLRSDLRYQNFSIRRIDKAMSRIRDMVKTITDVYHYNQELKHLGSTRFLRNEHVDEIFALLAHRSVKLTIHTYVLAMSALLRSGDYNSSLVYFEKLLADYYSGRIKSVNTVAFTAAIRSACLANNFDKALVIYEKMDTIHNCKPNCRTYQTMIRYFSQFWYDPKCNDIVRDGLKSDSRYTWEYCALLFARLGRLKELRDLFADDRCLTSTTFFIGIIAFALDQDDGLVLSLVKREEGIETKTISIKKEREISIENPSDVGTEDPFYSYIQKQWKDLALMAQEYVTSEKRPLKIDTTLTENFFSGGIRTATEWKKICDGKASLEIGCGSGDWMIAQVEQTENDSHWIACDIRMDRLWQAKTKAIFRSVDRQISFVGGDARISLESCPDKFFSHVYANFPEPSNFYDDPNRFYNTPMLQTIYRILDDGGEFLFFTDDARLAIDIVTQVRNTNIGFQIQHENGKPWYQKCPKSWKKSFFDMFWKLGSQSSRYFLKIRKPQV